jgi:hypothetical protein
MVGWSQGCWAVRCRGVGCSQERLVVAEIPIGCIRFGGRENVWWSPKLLLVKIFWWSLKCFGGRENAGWSLKPLLVAFILVVAGMFGGRQNSHWLEYFALAGLVAALFLVIARTFGGRQNAHWPEDFGGRKNSYWLQPPAACNASTGHEGFKFLYMYTQTANRHLGRIRVLRQRRDVCACQTGCLLSLTRQTSHAAVATTMPDSPQRAVVRRGGHGSK